MTNYELAEKAKDIALNYNTTYSLGCFGWYLTADSVKRTLASWSGNLKRKAILEGLIGKDYWMFDCVNLIKAIIWGWKGDATQPYGGVAYGTNGCPDINEAAMISRCTNISTDFTNVEIGEMLHMEGHCGIYIGNRLCVECTPKWKNGVQITSVNTTISGYNRRDWTRHGKLPYITYGTSATSTTEKGENEFMYYNIQLIKDLKKGDKGDDVKLLQARIAQISPEYEKEVRSHSINSAGQPDGSFGAGMAATLSKLQGEFGIPVTGYLDVATRVCLNQSIGKCIEKYTEYSEKYEKIRKAVEEFIAAVEE